MHGIRIEVTDPAHALKLMEFILQEMKLDPEKMEIKNRDMCSKEDWEKWK